MWSKIAFPALLFAKKMHSYSVDEKKDIDLSLLNQLPDDVDRKERQFCREIFKEIFAFMGFKCDLVFVFEKGENQFFNAAISTVKKVNHRPTAIITVEYADKNELLDFELLRGIAGHEAAHAIHHDAFIDNIWQAFSSTIKAQIKTSLFNKALLSNHVLRNLMMLILQLQFVGLTEKLLTAKISREIESAADLEAASTLGAANLKPVFLYQYQKDSPFHLWRRLTADHPTDHQRLKALDKLEQYQGKALRV